MPGSRDGHDLQKRRMDTILELSIVIIAVVDVVDRCIVKRFII